MARSRARPPVPTARRIRRSAWLIGAVLVGSAIVWRVMGHSEEAELRARLERVGEALGAARGEAPATRRARLERVLRDVAAPDLGVTLPELAPGGAGAGPFLDALVPSLAQYEKTELVLGRVSSRVHRDHQSASSDVEGTFRGESAQGLYVDRRNALVRWRKESGEWKMTSVLIADRDRAQPEARP